MIDARYLPPAPDCTQPEEVYFPHPFWELSKPCGLYARIDGGFDKDHCHTKSTSTAKCKVATCYIGKHGILPEVYKKLRPDHGSNGTITEEGCYVLLE